MVYRDTATVVVNTIRNVCARRKIYTDFYGALLALDDGGNEEFIRKL